MMQQGMSKQEELEIYVKKGFGLFCVFFGLGVITYAINYANSQVLSFADSAWDGVFMGIIALFIGLAFATMLGVVLLGVRIMVDAAKAYTNRR